MTFYGIHVRPDGSHEVYSTTNGIDRRPIPHAAFGKPRDAIRYASMREAAISPLRAPGLPGDVPPLPPADPVSSPAPNRHTAGE